MKAKAKAATSSSLVTTSSASSAGIHAYSIAIIFAATNHVYLTVFYLFMHAGYMSLLRMDIAEIEKVLQSETSSE